MKQLVYNDPCARPPSAGQRKAPRSAPSWFAAKSAALFFYISAACSIFTMQEPSAPARTARISSEQGNVGQWRYRRSDAGYEFLNEYGTSVFVGRSAVTIRRPSAPPGGYMEDSLPLGEINIESVGAASQQGPLTLTFPTLSGKFMQVTVSPGGENPDVRAFVRE